MNQSVMAATSKQFLVLGASRSGYSLLIQVLNALQENFGMRCPEVGHRLRRLDTAYGQGMRDTVLGVLKKYSLQDLILYNGMFGPLTGGVRLYDQERGLVVRKYIGILGVGEVTLLVKVPLALLAHEPVVSITGSPDPEHMYRTIGKRAVLRSVRHPFGCVASSVFSVNAIASEYVQRFMDPVLDTPSLRRELALHKLTDLRFFRALVRYYAHFYKKFITTGKVSEDIRWESLIRDPCKTIMVVSGAAGLPVDEEEAARIWACLRYKNLNGPHKHNYRPGGGRITDEWRHVFCDEHLSVMHEEGLTDIAESMGYDDLKIDRRICRFQKDVSQMLGMGVVYERFTDRNFFELSYQKSNVDNSLLKSFQSYPWRENTCVERSSIAHEKLTMEIVGAVEKYIASIDWAKGQLTGCS